MAARAKNEKPLIDISYSTEAIIFMANLSSGERFRAIIALLLKKCQQKISVYLVIKL